MIFVRENFLVNFMLFSFWQFFYKFYLHSFLGFEGDWDVLLVCVFKYHGGQLLLITCFTTTRWLLNQLSIPNHIEQGLRYGFLEVNEGCLWLYVCHRHLLGILLVFVQSIEIVDKTLFEIWWWFKNFTIFQRNFEWSLHFKKINYKL